MIHVYFCHGHSAFYTSMGDRTLSSALNMQSMTILLYQMPNVKPDQADTYKCYATNEFGKAICTSTLTVFEGERQINYAIC